MARKGEGGRASGVEFHVKEVTAAIVGLDTGLVTETSLGLAPTLADTGAGVETGEPLTVRSERCAAD